MKNQIVSFKGSVEGVFLNIRGSDIGMIKEAIEAKIKDFNEFYKGVKFLGVVGKELTMNEILDINLLLKYKYEIDISLDEIIKDANEHYHKEKLKTKKIETEHLSVNEYPTKFVYGTIRSGQVVDYNGNIVIIGDVNPGGLLKAKGNIIVLGALKGIAYAGLDGDINSIVGAFGLYPNQLRIANIIVRAPDGEDWESRLPEVAKIINGEIIIEPYLPNK